jgi:hypothetical protein
VRRIAVADQKERAREIAQRWFLECGIPCPPSDIEFMAERFVKFGQAEYERGRRELTEEIFTAIRHFLPFDAEKHFCQEFGIEKGDAKP